MRSKSSGTLYLNTKSERIKPSPKPTNNKRFRGRFLFLMGLLNKELVAPFFAASGFHFLGCDFYHKGIDFPGVIWAEADASHARYAKGFVGLFGVVQRNCAYRDRILRHRPQPMHFPVAFGFRGTPLYSR